MEVVKCREEGGIIENRRVLNELEKRHEDCLAGYI
jgi:hypothetical protein